MIAVLGHDEMFGRDIVKNSGGMLKPYVIYLTLSVMVDDGFLTSREEEVTQPELGIRRRLFRATRAGRRAFSDYVSWGE